MSDQYEPLDCEGFRKLLAAVQRDEQKSPRFHNYRAKLAWVVSRCRNYAEMTGIRAEDLLDSWEAQRDYWYMNFYQEANQPLISDRVRVFETAEDMRAAIGHQGFICPNCGGVSKSPYDCTSKVVVDGKTCNWKAYGLFGCLGKGVSVFAKDKLRVETFFRPVAWEPTEAKEGVNHG